MKKHSRFEFVMEYTQESFEGDSQAQIFDMITAGSLGLTPKTKAKLYFEAHGISANVPDVNDKEKFYDDFFLILQENLVGTWKWYDSLCNEEHWRYAPDKNDLVRRKGMGNFVRTPEIIEKLKNNLEISHERRRADHELARRIAAAGGRATKGIKHFKSEEEKMAQVRIMRNGRLKILANETEEDKEARHRKTSEAMKLYHQRRREAGLVGYKKKDKEEAKNQNNEEVEK